MKNHQFFIGVILFIFSLVLVTALFCANWSTISGVATSGSKEFWEGLCVDMDRTPTRIIRH